MRRICTLCKNKGTDECNLCTWLSGKYPTKFKGRTISSNEVPFLTELISNDLPFEGGGQSE